MRLVEFLLFLSLLLLVASQVLPDRVLEDSAPLVPAESWPAASDHRR